MKQSTKLKLFALLAALTLAAFGCIFGQDVKARSFRDESKLPYDSKNYYNLALIISSDGVVEKTDSIQIFIRERDSTNAVIFTVCEKTDIYLAYNKNYEIWITRTGYSIDYLQVSSNVKVKEYGSFIPIYLESNSNKYDIGYVGWDKNIDDVHYYPSKLVYK